MSVSFNTATRMNVGLMGSGRMCPSSKALPTSRPMNLNLRLASSDSGELGGSG